MLDEKTIKRELKRIREMSRVTNGEQPLNGIEHTLLWVLGTPDLITPSVYVDPHGGKEIVFSKTDKTGVIDKTREPPRQGMTVTGTVFEIR